MIVVDESYPSDLKPHEIAEYVSAKKAKAFDVNENETWVISSEMAFPEARKDENNRVLLARIIWSKPKCSISRQTVSRNRSRAPTGRVS